MTTLNDIVQNLRSRGVTVAFVGNGKQRIERLAPLDSAGSEELSFLSNPRLEKLLKSTRADAVMVREAQAPLVPSNPIVVDDPYYCYALAAQFLNPAEPAPAGIHPSAVIAETAIVDPSVSIGPHVVIGEKVQIGAHTRIEAGTVIGRETVIGEHCTLEPNVTLMHRCQVGNHVHIQAGAVLGGDGFGWAPHQGRWVKIPQTGRVIVGNRVSIGNNVCIDRGALQDTIIEDNVIIDNLVDVAHNVEIGAGSAIAAQSGFAGTTRLGRHCVVAGQVGFTGHLQVADNVQLMGKTVVTRSITQPGVYAGFPATPIKEWRKNTVRLGQLEKLANRVRELEKELERLRIGDAGD